MQNQILGLHHVTAIADNAQRNHNFYTQVLGQRMVKKTVNFDDPGTYHFYYGNEHGEPGTILTFFPWQGIGRGIAGTGMATEISFAIAPDALDFWTDRFKNFNVKTGERIERFGETYQPFSDHDGLQLSLVGVTETDTRKGWETKDIKGADATKGFYNVTLSVRIMDETAKLLTDVFGYKQISQESTRFRFKTDSIHTASIIDILELPDGKMGRNSAGTNHHIAFRVPDEETQMVYREKLLERGLNVTHQIDRDYFFSIYFREPGGILFEIATNNPGFTVDEPIDQLGTRLRLPKQYEHMRGKIEASLPALK
jgi:glyoxalase family protein